MDGDGANVAQLKKLVLKLSDHAKVVKQLFDDEPDDKLKAMLSEVEKAMQGKTSLLITKGESFTHG